MKPSQYPHLELDIFTCFIGIILACILAFYYLYKCLPSFTFVLRDKETQDSLEKDLDKVIKEDSTKLIQKDSQREFMTKEKIEDKTILQEQIIKKKEALKKDRRLKEFGSNKGIVNPGLDCFLVSALQCFVSIPEFFSPYDEPEDMQCKESVGEMSVLNEIIAFRERYYQVSQDKVKVGSMRNYFDQEFPRYSQHDSCQYIMSLFEILQTEINKDKISSPSKHLETHSEVWNEYIKNHPSTIDQLFVGMYETCFVCKKCENSDIVYEEFKNIPLICNEENPNLGFEEFLTMPENIEESEFICRNCQEVFICEIFKQIIKFPKYLIMVFQRINPISQYKINSNVFYPLSFSQRVPSTKEQLTYNLESIISHTGTLSSGHYTATCKRDSKWVHFNDSSCNDLPANFDPTSLPNAYILFYKTESNCDI
ncbi:unnamed protein product [Moneuplotes crassus]|uniref:USP domain-containing protein n=1 Tax=Euplotes crassus TaxID=5936 RepID=A0AAD1XG49_EUPCR|nr:unnamed protein product [Moneuplotes crassus]